jgi:hypothetical protein
MNPPGYPPPQQGYPPPPGGYGQQPGYPPPQGYGAPDPAAFELGKVAGEIKNQAIASLVVGIVGLLCFGFLLGPFAIYRGSKALRLMRQYNIGLEHKRLAQVGRVLGILGVVVWLGWLGFSMLGVLMSPHR